MRAFSIIAAVGLALAVSSCNSTTSSSPGGGSFDSGSLSTGAGFSHSFAATGSFGYHCTIHPDCVGLQGTVKVVDSGTTIPPEQHILSITQQDAASGGCSYSLSASSTTIHPGETVQWTNNSHAPHTVTSN